MHPSSSRSRARRSTTRLDDASDARGRARRRREYDAKKREDAREYDAKARQTEGIERGIHS
jgi:hypothetical protein